MWGLRSRVIVPISKSLAAFRGRGFTLIEMIMVIMITGIIAVVVGRFIAKPIQGFIDLSRRAQLVDVASVTLERMSREIRLALPNSIRVDGTGRVIEFARTVSGARYRSAGPGDVLDFTANTDTFDVLGVLPNLVPPGLITSNPGAVLADCVSGAVDCLAIYNTGQVGADFYAADNIAALQGVTAVSISFNGDTLTPPFTLTSPGQRFFIVDEPVAYLCDLGAGSVVRYAGHVITPLQANVDSVAELTGAGAAGRLLADGISACSFSYQAGTATRGGLLTLRITVSNQGERVALMQQVHVSNVP